MGEATFTLHSTQSVPYALRVPRSEIGTGPDNPKVPTSLEQGPHGSKAGDQVWCPWHQRRVWPAANHPRQAAKQDGVAHRAAPRGAAQGRARALGQRPGPHATG